MSESGKRKIRESGDQKKEAIISPNPGTPESLSVSAPAKINLFLHVVGKRQDGYHLLESLAAFSASGDRLEIFPADELRLEVKGAFAHVLSHVNPSPNREEGIDRHDENLVLRAAKLLQRHAGVTAGAKIILHKKLPVASGIGGGSADAAAALRGLNRLWKLSLEEAELAELALALGSDVPVCLLSRAAWMRGVGETLSPITLPSIYAVLVNPGVAVPTAEVFKKFSGAFAPPLAMPEKFTSVRALAEFLFATRNMLEPAAISLAPAIRDVLAALQQTPGCLLARMSGSGATCFGLYETAEATDTANAQIRKAQPDWWCEAGRLK